MEIAEVTPTDPNDLVRRLRDIGKGYWLTEPDEDACTEAAAEIERLRKDHSFIWKWIERAIFDDALSEGECLSTLAHYPGAPWNEGRWDVDHKFYAERFYRQFPNARQALQTKEERDE